VTQKDSLGLTIVAKAVAMNLTSVHPTKIIYGASLNTEINVGEDGFCKGVILLTMGTF
jgi:hypothetical protein